MVHLDQQFLLTKALHKRVLYLIEFLEEEGFRTELKKLTEFLVASAWEIQKYEELFTSEVAEIFDDYVQGDYDAGYGHGHHRHIRHLIQQLEKIESEAKIRWQKQLQSGK